MLGRSAVALGILRRNYDISYMRELIARRFVTEEKRSSDSVLMHHLH
ncbi:MAG: hypothetical protein AAGJ95_11085 [Cyanobacteria bacterium J06554_11]